MQSATDNAGPGHRRSAAAGFTFAEVLAAMAFLAVLLPVIARGFSLAVRASVLAERRLDATQLAENMLNELIVTQEWESGASTGDFGNAWPGYSWELSRQSWGTGEMVQLTLTVLFDVQGAEQQVALSTLVEAD